jgi:predicted RNase H-like HicB family nuclease
VAKLVEQYQVVLERNAEDDLYYGRGVEYPYLLGHGKTPAAAHRMAVEGLQAAVEADLLAGQTPPMPGGVKRDRQINVRVSAFEKLQIESAARRSGFRGLADYLRHVALQQIT